MPPDGHSLFFVGNATTLLRLGPVTLLTDPNFLHRGERAYLGKGLVSKRLTEPALQIDQLPLLDAVVLSHMHGDHWDRVARRGLARELPVHTTPAAARALHRQGFSAANGLQTWQSTDVTRDGWRVSVTAVPGRHAPTWARALLPPVMGSVIDSYDPSGARRLRLYISGDTLLVDELREIPRRYPDVDVAVLHLGGTTLPGGPVPFGLVVTMDAVQGSDLLQLIDPALSVPIHHSDYAVFKSPLSDFEREVARRGLADRVRVVAPGGTVRLAGDQ
jgi:L-ascorbate metabolism protein UlaG (beta-lactamase superfamily)